MKIRIWCGASMRRCHGHSSVSQCFVDPQTPSVTFPKCQVCFGADLLTVQGWIRCHRRPRWNPPWTPSSNKFTISAGSWSSAPLSSNKWHFLTRPQQLPPQHWFSNSRALPLLLTGRDSFTVGVHQAEVVHHHHEHHQRRGWPARDRKTRASERQPLQGPTVRWRPRTVARKVFQSKQLSLG